MPKGKVLTIVTLAGALAACSPEHAAPQAIPVAPAADSGERIYSGNCVPCHQQTGTGIPGMTPSLAGSPVVLGDPAELARWVVKGQRPVSMPEGRYSMQMLQFGWMKPADAAALLTYLRSSFGNSGTAVNAAAVAQALGQ